MNRSFALPDLKHCLLLGLLLGLPLAQAQEAPRYAVDFENTELSEFIDSVGHITGHTFILDPRVKGTLSVRSNEPLSADQVYQVFLAQLRAQGFAVVELPDGQLKVVPDQAARLEPVPVEISTPNSQSPHDGIATRVFSVEHADTEQVLTILKPLIDARVGVITPYPASNLLVVTDWRSNLARIGALLEGLDQVGDAPMEIMPLDHAQAKDTAVLLNQMLQRKGGRAEVPLVLADTRSNSLLVGGSSASRDEVRRLLHTLDVAHGGTRNTEVVYLHHASAAEVVQVMRALTGEPVATAASAEGEAAVAATGAAVRLEADTGTNAIVMVGPDSELQAYRSIIDRLDIRRAQVVVEAIIAEVSDSRASQLGVQWLFLDRSGQTLPVGGVNFTNGTSINSLAAAAASEDYTSLGSLLSGMQGVTAGVGRISSGISFVALLNALKNESGFNLLSTPTLLTLDNAEASILVGQEVPFVTGSVTQNNTNPYQTIERKEVGVKLRLKPQINAGNSVRLDIVQEVSSLADNAGASDVITNKREIKTTVMVEDNGLVVLGGLISDELNNSRQKVPLLGDIPGLGRLFRSDSRSHAKQNLMVFIRPRILRDPATLEQISQDKYRSMSLQHAPMSPLGSAAPVGLQALFPSTRERLQGLAP